MQHRPETIKVKDCPIYDQLCTIFTDTSPDGKYAQSSHFEGLDKSIGNPVASTSPQEGENQQPDNPPCSKPLQGIAVSSEKMTRKNSEKKRKRLPDAQNSTSDKSKRNEEILETMAGAMLDMVAASKLRMGAAAKVDDRFTITDCIKALDEIERIDEELYFAALDLFEDQNLRETFLSLKGEKLRLTWLQGKCKTINTFSC